MANTTAYKPTTMIRRRIRLPRLGWSWVVTAIVLIAVARTWPVWTALIVGLLTTATVIRAIRPRRLNRLWNLLARVKHHTTAMPAPGHRTLDWFLTLNASQFEHAIAQLAGEHPAVAHAAVHGAAGDRGIDVLATLRDGRRILIQCKRYDGHNVGGPAVREIAGSVLAARCHAGTIVTTAGYTREACDTNRTLGLTLIDAQGLYAWANNPTRFTPWP